PVHDALAPSLWMQSTFRSKSDHLCAGGGRGVVQRYRAAERVDDCRVEVRAGLGLEPLEGLVDGDRGPVDAVGGHRVVGVADGDDARADGDLGALESVRVALSVESFVA